MVIPPPNPTTVTFTGTQMLPGFTGAYSTTKNAARIYAQGGVTLWSGFISGTEAKMTCTSDFGDFDGGVEVAVDGGAFIAAPRVGQVYTLFTGQVHAQRFVEFRFALGLGYAPYLVKAAACLSVTGQPPSLLTLSNKIEPGANSSLGVYSGAAIAGAVSYQPLLQAPLGRVYGSNVGSVKIRGAFSRLVVTLNGTRRVGVSKNGGPATFYTLADEAEVPTRAMVIPCDGSLSTYNVWDSGNSRNTGGAFCVAGDAVFADVGTWWRLDQYGDSRTFGSGPGALPSDTETMRVAAALGGVGSTNGISGLTIGDAKAMLDVVLPLRTVNSTDVAILALGGNSADGGIDQSEQDDYAICMDKLLAKGYSKVMCLGILNKSDAQPIVDAANAVLKAVMLAKNNPKLIWVDPITWTFTTQDGTHPDEAGYTSLVGFATPTYRALLGL